MSDENKVKDIFGDSDDSDDEFEVCLWPLFDT